MVDRIKENLKGSKYSFVLVLGGTNDLGTRTSEKITQNLSSVYQEVT